MECEVSEGFLSMISGSAGSAPRASAGIESVTRFIHKSCIASSGEGRRIKNAQSTVSISPMLLDKRKWTVFLMFSNIPRPCSTASTIVEKLSSVSIMSAAFLATSVPLCPIAQPISAHLSAGASFIPSPVMATTALLD